MHPAIEITDDLNENDLKVKPKRSFVIMVSFLSTIGAFLFGYDTGIVSGAMVFVTDAFKLDNLWHELIVSITIGGAWLFSLLAGLMADSVGRKPVILFSSVIFIAGSIVLGFAPTKVYLLIGRFVVGAGIGLASMVVPIYNAEIAPKAIRGRLVALYQNFICLGMFVAAVVAGGFSYVEPDGWRFMLGLAAVPALIQLIGFLAMPETPRYLVRKNKETKALAILKRMQADESLAEQELEDIRKTCIEQEKHSQKTLDVLARIFKTKTVRKALMIGCALQIFQQIVGINTVMYYTATIIETSGVKNKSTAIWYSAIVAFVPFLCNFSSFYFIEKLGRRKTFLMSLAGVIISLLIIGGGFQAFDDHAPQIKWAKDHTSTSICKNFTGCDSCIKSDECGFCYQKHGLVIEASCLPIDRHTNRTAEYGKCSNGSHDDVRWLMHACPRFEDKIYSFIVIGGLMLYVICFAFGMGPVPWVMNTEIYPLWARSVCIAIATSMNWLFNLGISMTFLTLSDAVTKAGAFYLYATFGFVGLVLFYNILPETKGISLEETEALFNRSSSQKSVATVTTTTTSITELQLKP